MVCLTNLALKVMLASAEEKRAQADKMADQVSPRLVFMLVCSVFCDYGPIAFSLAYLSSGTRLRAMPLSPNVAAHYGDETFVLSNAC